MEYNKNKLITDDGANLVAQSLQEGKKVNFDSFIITDTPLPNDRQLSAMTIDNFKNVRKYPITNLKKGKNSVQPEAKLDNNGLTDDYAIYAVGLLANISESNTVLFGITQNSEGTPAMLTKQTSTPYFITYDMGITVTNPDNYQATITPAGYVDQTTFDNAINEIHTDIKNIDLSSAINSANQYTDNAKKDLQEQIDGKQPNGDYVTNEDLNPKLNKKQDAGSYLTTDEFNKYDLSINDGKLLYGDKPLVTAIKPIGVTLSANATGTNINYQVTVDYDGGSTITNYQIFYKNQHDDKWQSVNNTHSSGTIAIDYGTYDLKVTASNEVGATSSDSVSVRVQDDRTYGASWNQGIYSTLTRTDSAVGMIAGINGNRNDFDNTKIWGAMHRVTDEQGNIFIRIPKLYIKKTQGNGKTTWQISLVKHDDDWYLPKCFWDFNNNKELPYVDVGAYLAGLRVQGSVVDDSASLTSGVNTVPETNAPIGKFRHYARNNGKGYQILDIHVWDVLQVLFIIEFATLDSQSIMYGNAVNYNSAYTDHMIGSSAGDSNNMKYRGIESLYCNLYQFVDGVGVNFGNIYVCDDANNYSDSQFSYPYKPISYRLPGSSNLMQSAGLDLSNPEVTLPTSTTSTQGYYNDYCWNDIASNEMMYVGGSGSGSEFGLFYAYFLNTFSYSYSNIGCRLIKKPVAN